VSIDISEEAGVRYLHFGSSWIQGAMRIARPWALELEYTREMMAALLLRTDGDWPKSVLLIGLGAASLTKFLYRYRPQARLTIVEIDARVVAAARQFFKLPEDPQRVQIVVGDGADYVTRRGAAFDLILVDGYDADAHPGALDSVPFYLNCRSRLRNDGLLVANFLSRRHDYDGSTQRMREAFDGRVLAFPSCESGNAIAIAAVGDPIQLSHRELNEQARALKRDTGLNLAPLVARLDLSRAVRHQDTLI
jgi:spermidine synthase